MVLPSVWYLQPRGRSFRCCFRLLSHLSIIWETLLSTTIRKTKFIAVFATIALTENLSPNVSIFERQTPWCGPWLACLRPQCHWRSEYPEYPCLWPQTAMWGARRRERFVRCGCFPIAPLRSGVLIWWITRSTPTALAAIVNYSSQCHHFSHHELAHQPFHSDDDEEDGSACCSSCILWSCSRSLTIFTAKWYSVCCITGIAFPSLCYLFSLFRTVPAHIIDVTDGILQDDQVLLSFERPSFAVLLCGVGLAKQTFHSSEQRCRSYFRSQPKVSTRQRVVTENK